MKNMIAVRAFDRLQRPIDDAFAEARYYDAGFDAGEFSGPACDDAHEAALMALAGRVASRFDGLTAEELYDDWYGYFMAQHQHELEALLASGKII